MKFNFEHLKQVQQQLAEMYDQENAYENGDFIHSISLSSNFDGKQWHASVHMQVKQFSEVVNQTNDRAVEVTRLKGDSLALHLATKFDGIRCVCCIYGFEMHNLLDQAGLAYDDQDVEELLQLWAYHNKWTLEEVK